MNKVDINLMQYTPKIIIEYRSGKRPAQTIAGTTCTAMNIVIRTDDDYKFIVGDRPSFQAAYDNTWSEV